MPAKSLSAENYFPHYQPLIYVPSGTIAGYELLARTHARKNNVVSAGGLFSDPTLPVSLKIGIDRHLRQIGFDYFAQHEECGFVSINISPDWISRLGAGVISPTLKMIDEAGLDPSRVVIEITETAGELKELQRLVKQYRKHGLRIAIDDFGAGNSQLDRIIALAPDIIKLDMRLFKNAARGGLSADVLLGLMAITERAGFEVVCEGVETIEEFCFGIDCGANYMQGYLFSEAVVEPLATDSFKPFIKELTGEYFKRKTTRLGHSIDHTRHIKSAVLDLKQNLQNGAEPHQVMTSALQPLGIMRFFICDDSGNQLSPNFEIGTDGICIEDAYIGYNWSWRPYFPTLLAMRNRIEFDLVASTTYRDASTRRLCKTFGLFLDDQRVLLVDAEVRDEVLLAQG
ncbi:MAG: hypothetical protein JWM78_750 [Verrucomicrobiaceae bacterium]|nr:hypothetical protein [Verrucomicrobiaceae bacterium]